MCWLTGCMLDNITCDLNLIRDFMPGKKQYKVRKRNISKCLSRTKM